MPFMRQLSKPVLQYWLAVRPRTVPQHLPGRSCSRGFRDGQGVFLNSPKKFCGADGKFIEGAFAGAGLVAARGVLYSVQTRDLQTYLGDLGEAESKQVGAFHSAMFDLFLKALNYNFVEQHAWDCDHYGNRASNLLAGLLALAAIWTAKRSSKPLRTARILVHVSLF
jgi:hypothetical protein